MHRKDILFSLVTKELTGQQLDRVRLGGRIRLRKRWEGEGGV